MDIEIDRKSMIVKIHWNRLLVSLLILILIKINYGLGLAIRNINFRFGHDKNLNDGTLPHVATYWKNTKRPVLEIPKNSQLGCKSCTLVIRRWNKGTRGRYRSSKGSKCPLLYYFLISVFIFITVSWYSIYNKFF